MGQIKPHFMPVTNKLVPQLEQCVEKSVESIANSDKELPKSIHEHDGFDKFKD